MQHFANPANFLTAIASYTAAMFAVSFILYIYFGIVLMVLAKKTNTPGAALAWLPIGNLVLLCAIGRKPGWWVIVMLLVPFVGLLFAIMAWMAVAEARGKPAWLGALLALPVIGLLVPLALIAGPPTTPGGAPAPTRPAACPSCGAALEPGDQFCGECARPVPVAPLVAPGPRLSPAGALAGGAFGMIMLTTILCIAIGYAAFGRAVAYTPPNRKTPAMPQRMAGTLTEFPLDSSKSAPTHPTDVKVVDLTKPNAASASGLASTPMPPGITVDTLTRHGKAITTAKYVPVSAGTQTASSSPSGSGAPVGGGSSEPKTASASSSATGTMVSVLTPVGEGPDDGQALAGSVESATGGKESGVKLVSPSGATYTGWKIDDPKGETIILVKQGEPIIVIVYAPDPGDKATAERLTANVGNSKGLAEDAAATSSVFVLPASPPEGLTLTSESTQSTADLGLTDSDIQSTGGGDDSRKSLDTIKQMIPVQVTTATYVDGSGKEWTAFVAGYDSPRQAINAWYAFRLFAVGGPMHTVPLTSGDGLYMDDTSGGSRTMLFQNGPYLVALTDPSDSSLDKLTAFANAFQI